MRTASIIDWLQLLALIAIVHLVIDAGMFGCVVWLFWRHDGSVIQKLDEFIEVVRRSQ